MKGTRCACYLRSSRDRHDVSIDTQRRALHATAVARGLVVVAEFADAVESGKDEDRPAFQRMLQELRAPGRTWSTVLVLDTSRIARRRLIALMFERDCAHRSVAVVYNNLPDHDPATDMVLRSVLQAFDEYHSLISRAKGLAGMAENVRQGWRAGGRAPRGYQLEQVPTGAVRDGQPVTKSRLVIDAEFAPVVRAYLKLRAAGVPRGPAILQSRIKWPASSLHAMDWQALTYAGHTVWGVERDDPGGKRDAKRRPRNDWLVQRDTHPALITDAEAEAILLAREQLSTMAENVPRHDRSSTQGHHTMTKTLDELMALTWAYRKAQLGDGPEYKALESALRALIEENQALRERDASRLLDAWIEIHKRPASWSTAVEIVAVLHKLPAEERQRLLDLNDARKG